MPKPPFLWRRASHQERWIFESILRRELLLRPEDASILPEPAVTPRLAPGFREESAAKREASPGQTLRRQPPLATPVRCDPWIARSLELRGILRRQPSGFPSSSLNETTRRRAQRHIAPGPDASGALPGSGRRSVRYGPAGIPPLPQSLIHYPSPEEHSAVEPSLCPFLTLCPGAYACMYGYQYSAVSRRGSAFCRCAETRRDPTNATAARPVTHSNVMIPRLISLTSSAFQRPSLLEISAHHTL